MCYSVLHIQTLILFLLLSLCVIVKWLKVTRWLLEHETPHNYTKVLLKEVRQTSDTVKCN